MNSESPMSPKPRADRNTLSTAIVLMLLFGTQPIAMDLYLPALPDIATHFGGKTSEVQATLTVYLLAFGIAQLAAGPVADRYGRRSTLLWGLALYTLAALIGVFARDLLVLVGSRALQGVATAACVVSARAVIRDCFSGAAGLGIMARSMTGMSAIALLSPVLGGLVSSYFGWASTIALIGIFGLAAWLTVYLCFAESAPPTPGSERIALGTLLGHRQFLFSSLLAGASFSGAVAFLLLSPFIFIGDHGMSKSAYGLIPAVCSLAFLSGTVLCRHLLKRRAVQDVVRLGALFTLVGGAGQFLLWQAEVRTLWALLLPQCLYMLGHGIHQPCGQAGAVAPFPACAGRAAAISGFIIIASAFLVGQLVAYSGLALDQTLVTALSLLAAGVTAIAWLALPAAYGRAAAAQPAPRS